MAVRNWFLKLSGIAGLTALAALGTSHLAEARTLKGAYYVPIKHPVGVAYQALADELKKSTKGALTLRLFGGESLLAAKAISDGLRDQVADVGQMIYTYTPAYYPHGLVINDLAMVGPNDTAAMMAITELYLLHCQPCMEELGRQKQLPLAAISTPPYVIIANGDFNSPEKLRLKKLRAGGALWDRFSKFVDAVGVNMPTSGMYEAISRGTLDGAIYAVGGLKTHGLADVAKQVILLNLGSFRSGATFSMSKDTWASLSEEERKAFLKATAVASIRGMVAYKKGDDEGAAVAKAKKIPLVQPDPGLLKLRNDFVEQDLKRTVRHAEEELHLPDAAEFVANYRKLYDKFEKLVTPIEGDEHKLAELMQAEIYSKLDLKTFGMK